MVRALNGIDDAIFPATTGQRRADATLRASERVADAPGWHRSARSDAPAAERHLNVSFSGRSGSFA
jgi:hypothetical protein